MTTISSQSPSSSGASVSIATWVSTTASSVLGLTSFAACAGVTRQDGPEVNLDTRYDMASCTKVLAPTMIALKAIEEGLLTLDDTVGLFFDAPEDKRDITVRMLMTHTSGITPAFSLAEEAAGPQDVVWAVLAHPLEGTPGDAPRYSCMGYILLTKMLETLLMKLVLTLVQ